MTKLSDVAPLAVTIEFLVECDGFKRSAEFENNLARIDFLL